MAKEQLGSFPFAVGRTDEVSGLSAAQQEEGVYFMKVHWAS